MKPYIVRSHDYSGDGFAIEFDTIDEALKCIRDDLVTVKQNMKDEGYEYKILEGGCNVELYVPDSDIYYEWKIVEYGNDDSINDYIDYLDDEQLKVEQELLDIQKGKMKFSELSEEIRIEYETWLKEAV